MTAVVPAIDTFVNVNMGSMERPDYLVRVAEDYFKRSDAIFRDYSPAELLEQMDEAGVEKAIITVRATDTDPLGLAFPKADPDRFVLSVSLDPRLGMKGVRGLCELHADHPVVLARVVPFFFNLAPDSREYYPI